MRLDQTLDEIYRQRFSERDAAQKNVVWREIVRFLQRFVDPESAVLDLACGRGEFIRNIVAREKWATDVRDVAHDLGEGIQFVQSDGLTLTAALPSDYFDVVFMSNYLEHLPSGDAVVAQFKQAFDLLKPSGRVIVLQPNIRLIGGAYWDFIDHKVPLTEKSLVEAAELAGFVARCVITRFLPYTTKSRLPRHPALVRLYLALRPVWWFAGRQTLYVGDRA
jgi:SAM-dependent methyltransferase